MKLVQIVFKFLRYVFQVLNSTNSLSLALNGHNNCYFDVHNMLLLLLLFQSHTDAFVYFLRSLLRIGYTGIFIDIDL